MSQDRREVLGGIAAAVGAELLVVLAIFFGAAIAVNAYGITSAIGQWVGQ